MRQGGTGPYRKGHWSVEEDIRLIQFVRKYGEGRWSKLAKTAGLQRCGKSCRLRWVNYLRPDIKRGHISEEEERLIIKLHSVFGNKWSLIAIHLPGRSDNEIKNYWRSHIKKKLKLEDLSMNTDTQSSHIDSASSGTSQNGEGCNIAMMDSTSYHMLGFDGSTNPPLSFFGHTHDDDDEDGYELHNSINSFGTLITNEVILPSYKNNMPTYANLTQETSQFQLTKDDTSRLFTGDTMLVHDESPNNSYNQYLGNSSQGHFDALGKIDDPPCSGGDGSWEFYASRQAIVQETCNIPTNKQQALALHDSDVPWDVETIQPIVEVQNSPYAANDNTYGCELWDSADLFPEAYPNFQE